MPRIRLTGAQVRAIRGEDTQSDFARLVGASSGGIVCRWEHGHFYPSRAVTPVLVKLARERGVDLGNGEVYSA